MARTAGGILGEVRQPGQLPTELFADDAQVTDAKPEVDPVAMQVATLAAASAVTAGWRRAMLTIVVATRIVLVAPANGAST